jgi:ParB family chromosome partitioning protein
MSHLQDKAKKINLIVEGRQQTKISSRPEAPRTGVGAISAALAIDRSLEAENTSLKARVKDLEEARVVEILDPKQIVPSRWANRHAKSFQTPEFQALKDEIAAAGRNVQAIKVRRAGQGDDGRPRYEVVFGHRRHRACLELGLPVGAVVEDLDDATLFAEMDRENRQRKDLSPWEQGVMYRRALDEGLFPSQRRLSEGLGVNLALVSRAIALASLPAEVVAAFNSPMELQYRWTESLAAALQRDPDGVISRARDLAQESPRRPAKDILEHLLATDGPSTSGPLTIGTGNRAVRWQQAAKGAVKVDIPAGALTPRQLKLLQEWLQKAVNG